MLHSDVLWVTFELPSQNRASAPPTGVKNAFDVLRNAQRQSSKSSLPSKYPNPINGTFKVFNHLVDLCQETFVFFRYLSSLLTFKIWFFHLNSGRKNVSKVLTKSLRARLYPFFGASQQYVTTFLNARKVCKREIIWTRFQNPSGLFSLSGRNRTRKLLSVNYLLIIW